MIVFVLVALGLIGPAPQSAGPTPAPYGAGPARLQQQVPAKAFRILLTNDDGIRAPGLSALYQALSPIAEVTVVAPAQEQSGVGHGITYRTPIFVTESAAADAGKPWYAVEALPATCVRLALAALLKEKPDLVISGINRGANLGLASYFSGTCGAAREAAFSGIPAIAVSLETSPGPAAAGASTAAMDYKSAAQLTRRIVELIRLKGGLPPGTWLNINYPPGLAKGARITRQSVKPDEQTYEERRTPRGQRYFWSIYRPVESDEPGTDVAALREGFASITPMQLDQTAASLKPALEDLFRDLIASPAAKRVEPALHGMKSRLDSSAGSLRSARLCGRVGN
jgi:5'-nucleotidase